MHCRVIAAHILGLGFNSRHLHMYNSPPFWAALLLCGDVESKPLCFRRELKSAAMPEASELGSRTLSRFGVVDEQIYLVIRDRFSPSPPNLKKNEEIL